MTERVVIAGGGITGLATAYALQKRARASRQDVEIMLVERDQELGGKTRTEIVDGMVIEQGPDSFIAHKPWFGELCRELGLALAGTNPKIHTTYIYHRGRMEPLPVGMQIMIPTQIWPFVKTRLVSPLGKLRAALEPLMPVRQSQADESIGSFVSRRFGREVLENVAGPLMGGIYGGDWNNVSIRATFPMFAKMEQEQGSLLLAARKNRANRPKGPTGSAFQTVTTGLASVVDALTKATPDVQYRPGTTITAVAPDPTGEKYLVEINGETVTADAVVLAVPAYVAASLIDSHLPDVAGELNEIPYGNSVVVALGYNRADINHPLDASGFLVPASEPMEVTASTWVSSKWPHAVPQGKALLRCFLGRAGGRDWTREPDDEILAEVRRGLHQVMGIAAEPILSRIFRWPRAMAGYRVGHLDRIDRVDQLMQQAPGLYLAGAAYRGVGLPDCVREGNTAAQRVAEHLGWKAVQPEPRS